jgi:hypothetical protein
LNPSLFFLALTFPELWDISKFPNTYVEFIKDRRARRITLLKQAVGLTLPLPLAPHYLVDMYEDLACLYSSLMDRVFPPPKPIEDPTSPIFTAIAVEIARRYPFLTPTTGYIGSLRYSTIWEVQAYGNPPAGYIEPPDAGYNDVRLLFNVYDPSKEEYYRHEFPKASVSFPSSASDLHIVVSYVYDNGYDGGFTFYRDVSRLAIVRWSSAAQLLETVSGMIELYSSLVVGNLHLSWSCGWIDRKYWLPRFELHVKELRTIRLCAARSMVPPSTEVKSCVMQRLPDLACVLGDRKTIAILDGICFDPIENGQDCSQRSRPSAHPSVSVLRCALRASRYIIMHHLKTYFEPRNNVLGENLLCPYDVFIRGTTTETNWRNHFALEEGVPLERTLCVQRASTDVSALSIRNPRSDLWPLWATEMMGRLAPDMLLLAVVCAAVRLEIMPPDQGAAIAFQIAGTCSALEEIGVDTTRFQSCLRLLGLAGPKGFPSQ